MTNDNSAERYARLTEGLFNKTNDNSLVWSSSLIYDGFETSLAGRVVTLSKIDKPRGSAPDYEIKILKISDYEMVDSFRDTSLADYGSPSNGDYSTYYQMMKAMYEKISRQLSGADTALDEILKELGS